MCLFLDILIKYNSYIISLDSINPYTDDNYNDNINKENQELFNLIQQLTDDEVKELSSFVDYLIIGISFCSVAKISDLFLKYYAKS